ncbi:MAG: transporter substrate-binding domain-containing protein [Pseudodesulfovibrio sp.]|uniref:Extracellular solute-binding protein family 3 n=1 Tax=Pseudodesulfovibrio aespoeensis (strain ATCC 700646 / DSM 10631 / Aspo-2) TaxID=643562 RepID=E6VY89_PSEA9|nr:MULTISPECIES: transporter substrate-binding domain-containing protein [Pseudodesulfovibrio]MBU4192666.1 transporter substrate-binding domain-containing protein [Pseudomonadota bacterium]ADU61547.1 extracellular solute-binding protein family 3 [Pseudodesulfovibrio aespoeensis Aspo-2]MBU4243098.1 transporter substrate-binding domain-containing protein [Pseudomonadota bacterium]MBU4377489.1 transporter substrate-binding domain-containing protein [Pseudomonadota bacterium]MBU4516935.1 transport
MAGFVLALVALAALGFCPPVLADGGVLRVSFNDLPPWKVLGPKGEPTGIDVEFLNMLAARMGLTVEYVHYPFKRGLKLTESGDVDAMIGVLRRPEREAYLHYIEPAYKHETSKAFFVLKGRENTIARHEDLYGLRVGTVLGGRYYPGFDDDTRIFKHPVTSYDLNFRMLLAGRIDAVVMTETAGVYRVAQLGLGNTVVKATYVHRDHQDVYMVLSKRSVHADRLEEFSRVMDELVREGALDAVAARFFKETAPQ